MAVFQADTRQFEQYITEVRSLAERVKTYDESDARVLDAIAANFKTKTDDFYREDRKLNIGIVGQVKAGKSTFLNTLLFNGEAVLPKAATPKTATLTKIEHAEENSILVEYYTADEWQLMEEKAQINLNEDIYNAARELMKMVRQNGIKPQEYIVRGSDKFEFATYTELMAHLNDYVGENGKYTPLVKSVTLHMDNDRLEGLSIVDTPGLNDPITSRTTRTREFMELCDVVFFLSQSSNFLDKSDWELLSQQLPQKGVKKLVLIGSKYDGGVRDVLKKPTGKPSPFPSKKNAVKPKTSTESVPEACQMVRSSLNRRAKEKIQEFIDILGSMGKNELIDVVRQCETPILVSSLAYNMAGKTFEQMSQEEKNLYAGLSQFSNDMQTDLSELGNFDAVKNVFAAVIEDKECIFAKKAAEFIPTAKQECRTKLGSFRDKVTKRVNVLENSDKAELEAQKKHMSEQINAVRADITSVFGEMSIVLESERAKGVNALRSDSKEFMEIKERTGTQTHESSYTTGHLWWKKRHYYTYETKYTYCSAADATENMFQFAVQASQNIGSVFTEAIDLRGLRRKLLDVIVKDFDMGSEKYDASLFRMIIEEMLMQIEVPTMHCDVTEDVKNITSQFAGEITSADKRMELKNALAQALSQICTRLSEKFADEVSHFKQKLLDLSKEVQNDLLQDIQAEFETLLTQYTNKEKEIASYRAYIALLDNELTKG